MSARDKGSAEYARRQAIGFALLGAAWPVLVMFTKSGAPDWMTVGLVGAMCLVLGCCAGGWLAMYWHRDEAERDASKT